ncbi:hypothetical protein ACFCYI_15085 [Streptomyces sp. NPDC056257]|uniref:hypothetical protein n=1 Tax=Streptomyces sp. NPDC056257 TaxID=3345765 RepID=UPI0035D88751
MAFVIPNSGEARSEARPVAQRAELLDIRAFSLHAEILDLEASQDPQKVDSLGTSLGVGRDDGNLTYRFEYELVVKGANGRDALKFQVTLGALFAFPAEDEPGGDVSEENILAFGLTAAQLAVHPYLRSAVADLTARLGCPQVTLGLFKA